MALDQTYDIPIKISSAIYNEAVLAKFEGSICYKLIVSMRNDPHPPRHGATTLWLCCGPLPVLLSMQLFMGDTWALWKLLSMHLFVGDTWASSNACK